MDVDRLRSWRFASIPHNYKIRDTLLYALSVCPGAGPMGAGEVDYLRYENPQVLPSMSTVLGSPGFWLGQNTIGIDPRNVLHGEQSVEMHRPLEPAGFVVGKTCVEDVTPMGGGFGYLIYLRRELEDASSGQSIATLKSTLILRDAARAVRATDSERVRLLQPTPRSPTQSLSIPTSPRSALLYRLNGDYNLLHTDAAFARASGFPAPILHGLCVFGMTCFALTNVICENRANSVKSLSMRFTGHVIPGEVLQVNIWPEAKGRARFNVSVPARSVVVIDHGVVGFDESLLSRAC